MKQTVIGCGIGVLVGVGLSGLLGMAQPTPDPFASRKATPLMPDAGNAWGVVHLTSTELGFEKPSQSTSFNGRVHTINKIAFRAEGKFRSFENGWLRLTTLQGEEVWVPEHAIRVIEWMPGGELP
ncbi:hypothetical protein MNBD_PLANCTO03-456 [hydrothermal vent metagenome]|uniref:Uncharacterized protein n=1 Tax=hydrothermal vent metagenome TaxID=652676 RepID=A0A3B1DUQ3_9ZZZZ